MKVLPGVVAEDSEEDHEALGEAVEEAVEEEDVEVEIEVEDAVDLVAAIEPATIATRRVILQENAQNRTNVTDKPRCCTITEKKVSIPHFMNIVQLGVLQLKLGSQD